jgi:hypothetical protein
MIVTNTGRDAVDAAASVREGIAGRVLTRERLPRVEVFSRCLRSRRCASERSAHRADVQNPLRQKSNLLGQINLICPVHPFTPPGNF